MPTSLPWSRHGRRPESRRAAAGAPWGTAAGRSTSGAEAAAAMGTALGEHPAAALGRHARPEAMTALAHQFARLIGPLHRVFLRLPWLPMARLGGAGSVGYRRPPSENRNWSGSPPFSSPAAYKGGQPCSSMQGPGAHRRREKRLIGRTRWAPT